MSPAGRRPPLRIEEARGTGAIEQLSGAWARLHAEAGAPPFLDPEWSGAFQAKLGAGRVPRLVLAWDADRLAGLLPLAEEEVALPGLAAPVRRTSFLVERHTGADYLDVLAAPDRAQAVATALVSHVLSARGFDLLELDGLAADSPTLGPLLVARDGIPELALSLEARFVCPQLALDAPWPEVLARGRRADNFRRRLRRLREQPGFARRVATDPGDVPAAFERFLLLHDARWAGQGGSDALARPAVREFHRDVVVRLARAGRVRFEELWAADGCRASIYVVEAGERACFYQTGYDPAWADLSVGLVLLGLSIEDAIERGRRTYDFLRGIEAYKFDWATGTRSTIRVRLARRGLPAALLLGTRGAARAARAAAHAVLPDRAVQLLRRLRRRRERGAAS